jgi:hypothetical protein
MCLRSQPLEVVLCALRDAPLRGPVSSLLKKTRALFKVRRQRRPWTMGKAAAGTPRPSRLCTYAGAGGDVRARGDLASVCSRSGGSRRAPRCGKARRK